MHLVSTLLEIAWICNRTFGKVVTFSGATKQLSCKKSCQLMQGERFSVCMHLRQSRSIHIRVVIRGHSTALNCCYPSLYFGDAQHNHVFFADGELLGGVLETVITQWFSISLFNGSFIVCQFTNN